MHSEYSFQERSVSHARTLVIDAGYLANKRHVIYGMLEADVTAAKERINTKAASSNKLSFTAYIVACIGRAVAEHPAIHGYQGRNKKLVLFDDVDIVVMIEAEKGATAFPHIVRRANLRSVEDISNEIRHVQTKCTESNQNYDQKKTKLFTRLPRWMRMIIYRHIRKNPETIRKMQGTVIVTSTGMMAAGRGGWGLAFLPMHTLGLTLGGMQKKPAVVTKEDGTDGIEIRSFLSITLAFDHDIVDGAPATRFAACLVNMIESGRLLS
jgi:pyruvate/2-oxoglutarate dehydrogenase complex dihydrolipoamide acyltransferase (E2) component